MKNIVDCLKCLSGEEQKQYFREPFGVLKEIESIGQCLNLLPEDQRDSDSFRLLCENADKVKLIAKHLPAFLEGCRKQGDGSALPSQIVRVCLAEINKAKIRQTAGIFAQTYGHSRRQAENCTFFKGFGGAMQNYRWLKLLHFYLILTI